MQLKTKTLFVTALFVLMSVSGSAFWTDLFDERGDAAVIDLSGNIVPSSQSFTSGDITPEQVRSLTGQAKNEGADAIIYEINSGGGAVVASKEVMRAIDAADVPTVCRVRDVGASGAYLASLGCDQIVVDEVSVTGSIGVTASYPEFSELMDELGIEYVNITSGEYKELGSPFDEATEEELEILQQMTDTVHEDFIELVDDNRNLTDEELEEATTGRIFLGEEAEELGLVDELGGRETSVKVAENMTDKELRVFRVEDRPEFGLLELFFPSVSLPDILNINSINAPLRSVL